MSLLLKCIYSTAAGSRRLKPFLNSVEYFKNCVNNRFLNNLHSKTPKRVKKGYAPFEVDTNVTKDVILFRYDNKRLYQVLTLFGLTQCGFWMYLAHFSYYNLRDAKQAMNENDDKDSLPWWKRINLGKDIYKSGITGLCLGLGYLCLAISLIYPLRSIHQLHLLKGGKDIKIITYSIFGRLRSFTAPVNEVTCLHPREGPQKQIAMKIKNRYMFFLLDKSGKFTNTELYDFAVGLKRIW